MNDKLAAIKHRMSKQALIAAYEAYERNEPGGSDLLYTLVNKFAQVKLYHLEHEFSTMGSANTVDDWAQEVTIKVWMALEAGKFRGTSKQFYSWVHKIAFNEASDAFNELLKKQQTHTGLTVVVEGEDGTEEIDNPEIYQPSGGSEYSLYIPRSVQGDDLLICKLILFGWNYERIGRRLGITEKAVRERLYKLRKRIKAERAAARAKQEQALAERKTSFATGLAELRAQNAERANRLAEAAD